MKKSDSVVIIPTYNEKENVEQIIRAVLTQEHPFHVLIIDDGSPDGTAAIVERLMATEFADELHLIKRAGKLGLGTAYITVSVGLLKKATTISSRWMPTSATTLTTCRASIALVPMRATMWL